MAVSKDGAIFSFPLDHDITAPHPPFLQAWRRPRCGTCGNKDTHTLKRAALYYSRHELPTSTHLIMILYSAVPANNSPCTSRSVDVRVDHGSTA